MTPTIPVTPTTPVATQNPPPASPDSGKGTAKSPDPSIGTPKYLTAEDAAKLITNALKVQQQSVAASAERDSFINSEISGIMKYPKVYKDLLGTDKSKWPEESKAIRKQFEADFKLSGAKIPDVGGATRDGGQPASEWRNTVPRSAVDLIASGLAKRRSGNPNPSTVGS